MLIRDWCGGIEYYMFVLFRLLPAVTVGFGRHGSAALPTPLWYRCPRHGTRSEAAGARKAVGR